MNIVAETSIKLLYRLCFSRKGQTLVEYSLVLAVVSVALIAAFGFLSARIIVVFSAMENLLDTAQSSH